MMARAKVEQASSGTMRQRAWREANRARYNATMRAYRARKKAEKAAAAVSRSEG